MQLHLRRSLQQIVVWLLFQTEFILQSLIRLKSLDRRLISSLGLHAKKCHSVPGCSDRIDSTSHSMKKEIYQKLKLRKFA